MKKSALKVTFHYRLDAKVITEQTCWDDKVFRDSLPDLTVYLDKLLKSRQTVEGTLSAVCGSDSLEPAQIGHTKPRNAERIKWSRKKLCFYYMIYLN